MQCLCYKAWKVSLVLPEINSSMWMLNFIWHKVCMQWKLFNSILSQNNFIRIFRNKKKLLINRFKISNGSWVLYKAWDNVFVEFLFMSSAYLHRFPPGSLVSSHLSETCQNTVFSMDGCADQNSHMNWDIEYCMEWIWEKERKEQKNCEWVWIGIGEWWLISLLLSFELYSFVLLVQNDLFFCSFL